MRSLKSYLFRRSMALFLIGIGAIPQARAAAPVSVYDYYSTYKGVEIVVPPPGVLDNDTDADGDRLTAVLDTAPANGTLTLSAQGGFSYAPASGYAGMDSFTYHVTDGVSNSAVTTVQLRVGAIATGTGTLLNGSFEGYLDGWDITAGLIRSVGGTTATQGSYYLRFNGVGYSSTGSLAQTFTTEPGQSYTLEFDAGLSAGAGTQKLEVTELDPVGLEGSGLTNVNFSQTVTLSADAGGVQRWFPQRMSFVARGYLARLTLKDKSEVATANDLLLDNLRLSKSTTPVSAAPVAMADSYQTPRNTPLVVSANGVLANDSDPDGTPLTAMKMTSPAHGLLTWTDRGAFTDGGFTYTPDAGYTGLDTFSYYATDGVNRSAAVVTISVVPASNVPPVAAADVFTADQDETLRIPASGVLANDTDGNNDLLEAIIVTPPSHGVIALSTGGGFNYTPAAGYLGTDTFTYRANDGQADSSPATVTVKVCPPSVLKNGSFEPGLASWYSNVDAMAPAPGWSPTDGARFRAFDISSSYWGLFQSFTTEPGQAYTFTFDVGTQSAGEDPLGVEITLGSELSVSDVGRTVYLLSTVSVGGPGAGKTWSSHSFSFVAKKINSAIQVRVPGGSPGGKLLLDNMRITRTPPDASNTAPVASGETYSTAANTTLLVKPDNGLLVNDTDAEGSPLTAVWIKTEGPFQGQIYSGNPIGGGIAAYGIVDGGFIYIPAPGFVGTDSFFYYVTDGTMRSGPVKVTIQVTSPPFETIPNGSFESGFDGWKVTGSCVVADSGPFYLPSDGAKLAVFNGDNQTPSGVLSREFGVEPGQIYELGYDVGVLSFDYSSIRQNIRIEISGEKGIASIEDYYYGDGHGDCVWQRRNLIFTATNRTAVVTFKDASNTTQAVDLLLDRVTLTKVLSPVWNNAPIAAADKYLVTPNTLLVVPAKGVLANDVDPDGHTLTAVQVGELPKHGALMNIGNGGFTGGGFSYKPYNGYTGIDTFTYYATDGFLRSQPVTVTLQVGPPPPRGILEGVPALSPAAAGSPDAAGDVVLTMDCKEEGHYVLERSTDLIHWHPVSEKILPAPGQIEFRDAPPSSPPPEGRPGVFYRIGRRTEP